MLINIYGGLGSGKTLLGVFILKKAYDGGKNVFSNITVSFAQKINLEKFLDYNFPDNSVILLDEVYTILESRLSTSNLNIYVSHIFFQSRKKGLDIITTSQLKRSIDVRVRALADIDVLAVRKNKDFSYTVFYNDELSLPKRFVIPYKIAQRYFQYYNTKEIVMDELMRDKLDKIKRKLQKSKGA